MMRAVHSRLNSRQALDIARSATTVEALSDLNTMPLRMFWVNIAQDGSPQVDGVLHGLFSAVRLRSSSPGDPVETEPKEPILPSSEDISLLWPVWIFGDSIADIIVIDAVHGEMIHGNLPAKPSRAKFLLTLLLVLSVVAIMTGVYLLDALSSLLYYLANIVLGSHYLHTAWTKVLVTIAMLSLVPAVFHQLRFYESDVFSEALNRLLTGRVIFPHEDVRLSAYRSTCLVMAAAGGVHLIVSLLGKSGFVISALLAAACCLLAYTYLRLLSFRGGHRCWHPSGSIRYWHQSDESAELTRTVVHIVWSVALVSSFISAVLFLAGTFWPDSAKHQAEIFFIRTQGVEIAAIYALVRSKLDRRSRIIVLLGLSVGWIAKLFFGTVGAAAFTFVTIALSFERTGSSLKESLFSSVRFATGAAIGRILGRTCGAFLLGYPGAIIGQVVGEMALGIATLPAMKHTAFVELDLKPVVSATRNQNAVLRILDTMSGLILKNSLRLLFAAALGMVANWLVLHRTPKKDLEVSTFGRVEAPGPCSMLMPEPDKKESFKIGTKKACRSVPVDGYSIHSQKNGVEYILTSFEKKNYDQLNCDWQIAVWGEYLKKLGGFSTNTWNTLGFFAALSGTRKKIMYGVFQPYLSMNRNMDGFCFFAVIGDAEHPPAMVDTLASATAPTGEDTVAALVDREELVEQSRIDIVKVKAIESELLRR